MDKGYWPVIGMISLGVVLVVVAMVIMSVILPYHVCSAILCYVFLLACVVCNIIIGLGKKCHVAWPLAFCEVGLCFALVTMLTGAWWGYHTWGKAWVWEPRLTGMFLMTLFFLSWRLACAVLGKSLMSNKKLTASLIVLGLPAMFFTHVAVRLFGGIHPASVSQSGTVPDNWWPLILIIPGELLIGTGLLLFRIQRIKKADRIVQEHNRSA